MASTKIPTCPPTGSPWFGGRLVMLGFGSIGQGVLPLLLDRLRLPRQQLELVGRSPAAHLGRKIALALYGLLLPVLAVGLANLAGYPFPVAIPAMAGLGLAIVFWLLPVARSVVMSFQVFQLLETRSCWPSQMPRPPQPRLLPQR